MTEVEFEECEQAERQKHDEKVKELEKENTELKHQLTHRNCVDCSNHSSKLKMRVLELEKENAELKEENERLKSIKDVATLINANNSIVVTLLQLNNNLVYANQLIKKLKKCDNCKENTTMNPYCIDCENHSKWELDK